jgi:hypothetical protein
MAGAMVVTDAAIQGVALLTHMQSSFNFTELGEAAISGAVSGGLAGADGGAGAFSRFTSSIGSFGVGVLRGATGSLISQTIDVATHLQKSVNWLDVGVAGVASGVSNGVLANAGALGLSDLGSVGERFVAGAAGMIAGAAGATLKSGTDFGDNILSELPDLAGDTIGNEVGGQIMSGGQEFTLGDGTVIDYSPPGSDQIPLTISAAPQRTMHLMGTITATAPDFSAAGATITASAPLYSMGADPSLETVTVSASRIPSDGANWEVKASFANPLGIAGDFAIR